MQQAEIYVWIITGTVMIAYVPYLLYRLGLYKFMKISIDVFFSSPWSSGVYITVLHCASADETVRGGGRK